jgi:ring-1,2-phenylacetyl-CoA epoxidase subunit PaaE
MANPQTTAKSPATPKEQSPGGVVPPGSAGKTRHSVFHLLRVSDLDRITDDAVAITFDVPDRLREDFRFLPGQHLSLRSTIAGDDVRRNYSICTPATSGKLRIGVKRLPDGVFSTFALERLQVGDALEVMTPTGRFTVAVDPANAKHYGAVAAGSGITPVLSILSTALEVEPNSRATLIYLNKSTTSIMFVEELEDLKNAYLERFQVVHVLDGERQDVEMLSGALDKQRLTAILDGLVPAGDVDEWFLCGPLGLTDMVRDTLVERGHDGARVHRELFVASTPPPRTPRPAKAGAPPRKGSVVEVILDGRSSTLDLHPDAESILDATLKLRGDAPYACKNGVCGTCRAKVIEGKVDMDQNYALEPDELAAGFVLAFQSHPTTDRVTLDFDQ